MFSAVSTASYAHCTVGAWQKQVLCFRFAWLLEGFILTANLSCLCFQDALISDTKSCTNKNV